LLSGKPYGGTISFSISDQRSKMYLAASLNKNVNAPATVANKGFNELGNPYTSQINV